MSEKLIQIQNIYFKAAGKEILKNVSFDINAGDFITIIGPNGAGKTTLLKILLGIRKSNSGKVIKYKNLKIGYVPQRLNVENNIPLSVSYFLKLYQGNNLDLFDKIVSQTKIDNLLNKQLSILSGGEKQRVLLAKALLEKPDLLILDEPAQNLDIAGQLEFYQLLNDIYKKEKMAVLMVSHDLHMVMSVSKKVICLFHHVCCSGEPDKVTKDPEFVSIFGDNMSKLVSIYNHYHNHKHH